jgi:hypothetical protein
MDRNSIIFSSQLAISDDIRAGDGCKFAFKTFVCHSCTPIFKDLNLRTQYLNYLKERRRRVRNPAPFWTVKMALSQMEEENQKSFGFAYTLFNGI